MAAIVASNPEIVRQEQRRRIVLVVVLASVGIHVAAGIIAGLVIIARFLAEPAAEFTVTKDIRVPVQDREHSMNMAAFDGWLRSRVSLISCKVFALDPWPSLKFLSCHWMNCCPSIPRRFLPIKWQP